MLSESQRHATAAKRGITQQVATTIANYDTIPPAVQAVLGYYGETATLSITSLRLQRTADNFMTETIRKLYEPVESEIARQIDAAPRNVSFEYDTKLTLPAELTIGHVYYRAKQQTTKNFDPVRMKARTPLMEYFRFPFDKKHETRRRNSFIQEYEAVLNTIERAEDMTELVTAALIDGDMRDALNDNEYEDFQVNFPVTDPDRRREIAECAQRTLQSLVEERFKHFDTDVREAYKEAVKISELHQERDQYFRELAANARVGEDVSNEIENEYKYKKFDEPPVLFDQSDLELPYLLTQYRRWE